ncbi:MAG TPA: M50 family metallopeptidase [Planctomycetota bacterium]|nr:M50 family metallopeptidase [Planctomycetota bacterium]
MSRSDAVLRAKDLLWLLLYPGYQVLGTIRHEASHALAAMLEGATIERITVLPRPDARRGILWGSVATGGHTTNFTSAAPYLVDLATYALFFVLCMRLRGPRWLWLNLAIVGVLSPAVDTLYAYLNASFRDIGDAAYLLRTGPAWAVHVCFAAAIAAYLAGIAALLRVSRFARA